MYDYNSIILDSQLTADFKETSPGCFEAYSITIPRRVIGTINKTENNTFLSDDPELLVQFRLWQTRPERAVGKLVTIPNEPIDRLIESYEELLIGCYILFAKRDNPTLTVDVLMPKIKSSIDWLRSTDFYTAPASTVYHESFVSGLLVHSLNVYNQAMKLREIDCYQSVPAEDIALVALVHDWCKIGMYQSYRKSVKNETTGQWDTVTAFKRDPKGLTLGHGVTSMYLANRCFNISPEMALAIRWHMGQYSVCDNEQFEMFIATETYPMVRLIQFADQLATTKYCF